MDADELYSIWYRGEKKEGGEMLYLSMHSEKWLSHEALVEEKIALGKFAASDNAIIYEGGEAVAQVCTNIKPVGYGNTDRYTWTFRRGKGPVSASPNENKALFDALEQLNVDSLDASTFTLLRAISRERQRSALDPSRRLRSNRAPAGRVQT